MINVMSMTNERRKKNSSAFPFDHSHEPAATTVGLRIMIDGNGEGETGGDNAAGFSSAIVGNDRAAAERR